MITRKHAIENIFGAMAQAHCDYNYAMRDEDLPKSEAYVTAMLLSADVDSIIEFAEMLESEEDLYLRCNGKESYYIVDDSDVLKAVWWRKRNF